MDEDRFDAVAPGKLVRNSNGALSFQPDSLPPDLSFDIDDELIEQCLEAMRALGQFSGLSRRVEMPGVLLSPFVYKEAVTSSRIEGTHVTVSEVYRYEAGGSRNGADGLTGSDALEEVHNYVTAIESGIDAVANQPLTLDLLKELHATLMHGVRGREKNPGEFRTVPVALGGEPIDDARFVPPPAMIVPHAMDNLETYIRTEGAYPTLIDIGLVHYQFETIHPFRDGNGRMGRLLVMLLMYQWGVIDQPYLYPSSYFNRHREEYTSRLFTVSTSGAWTEWLSFFLEAIREQAEEAYHRSALLLAKRDEYRSQYADARPTVRRLVDAVFSQPYFTVQEIADQLDVSYPTANYAVDTLIEDGVLVQTTEGSYDRVFRANDVLDLVERPGAELPELPTPY